MGKIKLIFKQHWERIHKKSGGIDFLYVVWGFGGKDFSPRWASITILNFEIGFEIYEEE